MIRHYVLKLTTREWSQFPLIDKRNKLDCNSCSFFLLSFFFFFFLNSSATDTPEYLFRDNRGKVGDDIVTVLQRPRLLIAGRRSSTSLTARNVAALSSYLYLHRSFHVTRAPPSSSLLFFYFFIFFFPDLISSITVHAHFEQVPLLSAVFNRHPSRLRSPLHARFQYQPV